MQQLSLHTLIGGGLAIYAGSFLAAAILGVYGLGAELLWQIILLLGLVALLVYMTTRAQVSSITAVLPYAIGWPLIAIVMDIIYAVPLSGWVLFYDPALWLGYGLIFLVPLGTVAVQEVL